MLKIVMLIVLFIFFYMCPIIAQSANPAQEIIKPTPKEERSPANSSPPHTSQHQERTNNYKQQPNEPLPIINTGKTTGKDNATQNSKNKKDGELEIQRQLAESTKTIANFTIYLVIATILLAIIAICQWCLSRKTLISTQRAFIFLKDIEFKEVCDNINPTSARWQFFTKWENSGGTPTKDLTINLGCILYTEMSPLPAALPDNFDFAYDDFKDIPVMIGPKAIIAIQAIELAETNAQRLNLATRHYLPQYSFYLWGEAKYRDVFWFTKKHVTRFCVELTFIEQMYHMVRKPPIMSFNYYKKYNYAD